jgi:Asp-tRNA(Asn)/Glu-tRNA(Gln) amidotransferase A subunit family amidase
MQMIGPAFSEARLLKAGAALEAATRFAGARPPHHSL